jgi:hypothetical protein
MLRSCTHQFTPIALRGNVWIAIIAATAAPLVYVAWLANPLSLVLFGAE